MSNEFALPKDSDPIGDVDIRGMKFDDLPFDIRSDFEVYPLDVVVISAQEEDEVREMFLRLQNGTTLKAQEKRNAMPGQMREFVKELTEHQLFTESVHFKNSRYAHDHVAAQLTLIELVGGPTNIRDRDLNKMYEEYKAFDSNGRKARKIVKVLDYLHSMFPDKTPELERYSVISLYLLISAMIEKFDLTNREGQIRDWFLGFEQYRRENIQLPEDQVHPEIVTYREKTSHSTDAVDSLQWRHDHLMTRLLEALPTLEQRDSQRNFTHEQRLAIYRRDAGKCQLKLKCDGIRCDWDNWHADHIIAWTRGGKTTVENGQVACPECNLAKGATVEL